MSTASSYSGILLALCIWREARGATAAARLGVKHVLLNRASDPKGPYSHSKDVVSNILCPMQFSSFNRTDPNASLLPNPQNRLDWQAWLECCGVVDSEDPDPTGGATHYFDLSIAPPAWAQPEKFTVQLDRFRFFKL